MDDLFAGMTVSPSEPISEVTPTPPVSSSAFSFLGGAAPANPTPVPIPTNVPATSAPIVNNPGLGGSMFGFVQSSSSTTLPPTDVVRKKTRRANVPGYAAKEHASSEHLTVGLSAQQSYSSGVSTSSPRNAIEREQELSVSLAVAPVQEYVDDKQPISPASASIIHKSPVLNASFNSTVSQHRIDSKPPPPPEPPAYDPTPRDRAISSEPSVNKWDTNEPIRSPPPPSFQQQPAVSRSPSGSSGIPPPPPPPKEPSPATLPSSPASQLTASEDTLPLCVNVQMCEEWQRLMEEDISKRKREQLDAYSRAHADMQRYQDEVIRLEQRLEETVEEQNSLCDQDKFMEAEALDVRISEMRQKLNDVKNQSEAERTLRGTITNSLTEITTEHLTRMERCLVRTKELQAEALENFEDRDFAQRRQVTSEANRLNSEMERIQLARDHLEKDIRNADEERQQVEAALEAQTKDHKNELQEVAENIFVLEGEIKSLEQEILKKKKEKLQADEIQLGAQNKIANIKSKFVKQLTRLEDADHRIAEARQEVDADWDAVQQSQAEHSKQLRELEELEITRKKDFNKLKKMQTSVFKHFSNTERHHRQRERWRKKRLPFEAILTKERQDVDKYRDRVNSITKKLQARHNESANLKSQLGTIDVSLPQMEANKKLAVSSRNFKEAGQIASEMKRLVEEKERIEATLAAEGAELAELQQEMESAQKEDTEKQGKFKEAEAEYDMKEIKILEKQICDLRNLSERSQRKGYLESRRLFDTEIEICTMSITHLLQKHRLDTNDVLEVEWSEESDFEDSPDEESDNDSKESRRASIHAEEKINTTDAAPATPPEEEEPQVAEPVEEVDLYELAALEEEYKLRVEDAQNEVTRLEKEIDDLVETEKYEEAGIKEEERTALQESVTLLEVELSRIQKLVARHVTPEKSESQSIKQEGTLRHPHDDSGVVSTGSLPEATVGSTEIGGDNSVSNEGILEVLPEETVLPQEDGPASVYEKCIEMGCPVPCGLSEKVYEAVLTQWNQNTSILELANIIYQVSKEDI